MHSVVITGGSRGLGLCVARRLAADGYRAIAIARHMSDQLSSAISETDQAGTGTLHFVPFDFCDVQGIPGLVKTLRSEFGPIYGLVNNAAAGFNGALAIMHNSQIERLIRVNTVAPIIVTKYMVRHMMADGGGRE